MDQNDLTATTSSRVPPKLDTIPEDIVVGIVEVIRSWTDRSKSRFRKDVEKARLLRDSILRSMVLTSRRASSLWLPFLLQDVTISVIHLPWFYLLLKKNQQHGRFIKSLHVVRVIQPVGQEKRDELGKAFSIISGLSSTLLGLDFTASRGYSKAVEFVYEQVYNLQVLRLQGLSLGFNFVQGEKLAPRSFLSKSLKKLYISGAESMQGVDHSLHANNASFCPQLNQCSLAVSVTHKDHKFVSELSNSFEGLSNVKHLALQVRFIFDPSDRKTWWGLPEEKDRDYLSDSKKTDTLYRFLKVTKKLLSLEIGVSMIKCNPGDDSKADMNCLSGVKSSFDTLEHLNLWILGPHREEECVILAHFKNLKSLSLDAYPLNFFAFCQEKLMPETVEVLRVPAYHCDSSKPVETQLKEDSDLAELLESRNWPALKNVIVFTEPIDPEGELLSSPEQKAWKCARQELESSNVFVSGKVKLTCLKPSEGAGHYLTGEKSMSSLHWLCP